MKLLKIFLISIISLTLFSCADPKVLKDKNGKDVTVNPYGWANEVAQKNDSVVYEMNAGNMIVSLILSETVIVPIYLTGWEMYEPVRFLSVKEVPTESQYELLFFILIAGVLIVGFFKSLK